MNFYNFMKLSDYEQGKETAKYDIKAYGLQWCLNIINGYTENDMQYDYDRGYVDYIKSL